MDGVADDIGGALLALGSFGQVAAWHPFGPTQMGYTHGTTITQLQCADLTRRIGIVVRDDGAFPCGIVAALYVPGAAIETERPSPRYSAIDLWESSDVLDAMIEGQLAAVAAVRAARDAIEEAAHAMELHLIEGGRLIYAGAGTSGRLAVQDGAELMPTFSWPAERLLLLIAGGNEALTHSVEGAEDDVARALALIKSHKVAANDVLLAAAASGTTPFTLACVRGAREAGALTVGIANNRGTPLLAESECPIFLDTGVEPIAGSTRMKAGTAQRIALNLLSSLVMIRLGHVYEGLMVDVQATNKKLTQRSANMLTHLTGRSGKDVRDALAGADGSVKVAVLLLYGCRAEEAKVLLERSGGHLRVALAELRKSRASPE